MTPDDLLTEGRRVRVCLSPECRHVRQGVTWDGQRCAAVGGHFPEENGRVGVIVPWPFLSLRPTDDHRYMVNFDCPGFVWYAGGVQVLGGAAYARTELVPLDADGRELAHPLLAAYER